MHRSLIRHLSESQLSNHCWDVKLSSCQYDMEVVLTQLITRRTSRFAYLALPTKYQYLSQISISVPIGYTIIDIMY